MDIQKRKNQIAEYYQAFGLKYLVKHSIKKILKCEQREYNKYREVMHLSEKTIREQRTHKFGFEPTISIVVPLFNTPETYLRSMIDSVMNQTYEKWELCLSDGGGKEYGLSDILEDYAKKDCRIKYISGSEKLNIARNTNRALTLCSGSYIAFMDHDDLLAENALFECVSYINKNKDGDLFYTDEDKVSGNGKKFFQPHFKPDFNKDLLLSMNYICHLVVVKRELLLKVGMIKETYEGAQDYDFLLRCIEKTNNIIHIPEILYHWRCHENSTAQGVGKKQYAVKSGRKALQDYFNRNEIDAEVTLTESEGIYRVKYALIEFPKVSIIIPNKDHISDLNKCLEAIRNKAGYNNYEILVIENNSEALETFEFYKKIQNEFSNINVLFWEGKFNYAAINNWGAKQAKGEYILFLNNDVEWISDNFLAEMVSVALRKEVGIVGNLLYFPDNTVQHAGVVMGYSGIAGHAFIGTPRGKAGYFSRIICMQNYSAVTAACMMIRKEVFQVVEGFDESFEVAFNDVDLCLRVLEKGKKIVYDPYAQAYHHESKTRGSDNTVANIERFEREKRLLINRWGKYIEDGDPYYNKNLTLSRPDFTIKREGRKKV